MTKESAKVFVAQETNVNYTPAEEFGRVVILSMKEIVPYQGSMSNVQVVHAMEKILADEYRAGVDYLLPTGSVLAMAHMFAAAFRLGSAHRVLKWDARAQRYHSYSLRSGRREERDDV